MSKTIWKYTRNIEDMINLEIPEGGKFLCAAVNGPGEVSVWVELDEDREATPRTLRIYGTGNSMPNDPGRYISTVIDPRQMFTFVWHVYEPVSL